MLFVCWCFVLNCFVRWRHGVWLLGAALRLLGCLVSSSNKKPGEGKVGERYCGLNASLRDSCIASNLLSSELQLLLLALLTWLLLVWSRDCCTCYQPRTGDALISR